jgi:hypothetical protein
MGEINNRFLENVELLPTYGQPSTYSGVPNSPILKALHRLGFRFSYTGKA